MLFDEIKQILVILLPIIILILLCTLLYDKIFNNTVERLNIENIQLKNRISLLERTNKDLKRKLRELTVYKVNISFYTLSRGECDKNPYKNALNKKPVIGRDVAVSRDLIHLLGKYVYIEGYGVKKVTDIMNSRYQRTVDILVGSKRLAKRLGRKKNINLKLVILSDYLE